MRCFTPTRSNSAQLASPTPQAATPEHSSDAGSACTTPAVHAKLCMCSQSSRACAHTSQILSVPRAERWKSLPMPSCNCVEALNDIESILTRQRQLRFTAAGRGERNHDSVSFGCGPRFASASRPRLECAVTNYFDCGEEIDQRPRALRGITFKKTGTLGIGRHRTT
jgi:hypothetical protein